MELASVTPKRSSARKSLVVRWNHSRGKSARGDVTVWYRLRGGAGMFPHLGWGGGRNQGEKGAVAVGGPPAEGSGARPVLETAVRMPRAADAARSEAKAAS